MFLTLGTGSLASLGMSARRSKRYLPLLSIYLLARDRKIFFRGRPLRKFCNSGRTFLMCSSRLVDSCLAFGATLKTYSRMELISSLSRKHLALFGDILAGSSLKYGRLARRFSNGVLWVSYCIRLECSLAIFPARSHICKMLLVVIKKIRRHCQNRFLNLGRPLL